MDFQLLRVIFTFGKFFGLTPSSLKVKQKSFGQKFYAVIFFIIFFIGMTASIYSKNFYRDYIHIKIAIGFFKEITLYLFYYNIILVSTFSKRKSWKNLIRNLGSCGKINTKKRYYYYYYGFFIMQLIYLSVVIYDIYFDSAKPLFEFLCRHPIEYLQNYLQLFYEYLLLVLVDMIFVRYRELNILLEHIEAKPERNIIIFNSRLSLIQKIETSTKILSYTVDIYNKLFGWPIAFLIFYATLDYLDDIDTIIYEKRNEGFLHLVAENFIKIVKDFVSSKSAFRIVYIYPEYVFLGWHGSFHCFM